MVGVETRDPAKGETRLTLEPQKRQMIVEDLLRHTSGLVYPEGNTAVHKLYRDSGQYWPSYARDRTLKDLVSGLVRIPLAYQPGEVFEYGLSVEVLGRVVEVASGQPLDQFFASRMFRPLGMVDTGFWVPPEKLARLIDPQHPLYDAALAAKFGDSIERVYRKADDFVGEVVKRVGPGVPVMIVSDHGFHSWRKAVNLDTWLVQNGYMVMKGQSADKKLSDLFGGGTFWENVDWSRTRAYAMGIGQIYFNLRGREAQGIVSPGAEATALADELSKKLLTLTDPEDGTPIIRAVYKRDDIYSGPFINNASELQVGMNDGYRVSWQTTLGGSPAGIVYKNDRKWSADHGGYDYAITSGILVTSQPINTKDPRIIDIAPTVLRYFGLSVPTDIDGKPLY